MHDANVESTNHIVLNWTKICIAHFVQQEYHQSLLVIRPASHTVKKVIIS